MPALNANKAAATTNGAATALTTDAPSQLKKSIVIFEVRGGTDKGPHGHRKDTPAIVDALTKRGWDARPVFYCDADREAIQKETLATADAFMMRVNPGVYEGFTDALFMQMGRELHSAGCLALQHPDVMLWDQKDSLVKMRDLPTGLPDTEVYFTLDDLKGKFPEYLAQFDRVLKQNRGSTGEGIWVVKPHGWERSEALKTVPLDAEISCTEMVDNKTTVFKLGDFMERCKEYVTGEGGLIVDQRFLPRIVEGEVRVLMICDKPVQIVHKRPAEGHMSATLFSGARYTYDTPDEPKWASLLKVWMETLPQVRERLGCEHDYPLIWTADFILDTNEDGSDAYRLGELNASCVGFSTHLEFAETIADSVITSVTAAKTGSAPSTATTATAPKAATKRAATSDAENEKDNVKGATVKSHAAEKKAKVVA